MLHGYNENFGFIEGNDVLLLMAVYCISAMVIYLLVYLMYHNAAKAALLTLYLLGFFIFYGALSDFLKIHLPFAARYSILLPLFLVILLVLLLYLKRTNKSFLGVQFFFNLLLCIYLVIDLAGITIKVIYPSANKFAVYSYLHSDKYKLVKNVSKPDIYFLVFDEYASSVSLRKNYGFVNELDSFLIKRGFRIQAEAYSNYNYTPASMASILNASYIKGIGNNTALTIENINYCHQLVKSSEVVKFITNQGYTIVNHSVFDLPGNPSPIDQILLPLKTRLITENTLFARMYKDLGWMLSSLSWLSDRMVYIVPKNNQLLLQMTKTYSARKEAKMPAFVYAHFYMPHDPYFFDRNGRLKNKNEIFEEENLEIRPAKSYLDYVVYVNKEIRKLVDTIVTNTHGKAVIMIMGDHGFRERNDLNLHENYQAMNAVYLPGKDYHLFYDSISSVNQFRVLFNTLFKQSLPLLKDSTIFLTGKKE